MDFSAIQSRLETWMSTFSGLTHYTWRRQKEISSYVPYPRAHMYLENIAQIGQDEVRSTLNESNIQTPLPVGWRSFDWVIQVVTDNQSAGSQAAFYVEKIRTRLRREASSDLLQVGEMAVVGTLPIRIVDYVDPGDGRWYSAAELVVNMTCVSVDSEDVSGEAAIDTIGRVTGDGEYVTDQGGVQLDPQPTFDVTDGS